MHPLTLRESRALEIRRARIARWKRYGKWAAGVTLAGGLILGGGRAILRKGPGPNPLNPNPAGGPENPSGRKPVNVDPSTPTRNGRQPVNENPTNQGTKPKTRAQRIEEVFKANENVRLKDKKFPFIPRDMSFEAAKKVINDVLEKKFKDQGYDFRHPSWQNGEGNLNQALQKAPPGSILQLSRLNPETGARESSFVVKIEDDFYYYAFLTDKGALRGESGSILNPVLNSTGSEIIGIYQPNP